MMNYIWGGMLILGIIYGTFSGNMSAITDAVISSSKEAVNLSVSMLGIVAFWTGLMEIAVECEIIEKIKRCLSPLLKILFPGIEKDNPALGAISLNFAANMLGLGWAATPAGLQAMKELQRIRHKGELNVASDEMCTFLVINISSLQLIPVNVIAYRSQYGSVNPSGIIVPGLIATFVSTITAIIICLVKNRGFMLRTKSER